MDVLPPRRSAYALQVKAGDPFSLSAINESQRRLTALGLFRRARITELRHGGETTPENGQALCQLCHKAKSRKDISAALRAASARRFAQTPDDPHAGEETAPCP